MGWVGFTLAMSVFLFEVVYRLLPNSLINGLDYKDLCVETGMNEGGFLISDMDTTVINSYGEKVRWITNSKGFRNAREFNREKPSKIFRILSLGDSFTVGYRVAQSETFSFLLQQELNTLQDSMDYEVIIGNIENPVYGIKYLNKFGLAYNPDIILLGLTLGNDLTQTYYSLCRNGKYRLVNERLEENPDYSKTKLTAIFEEKFPTAACDYSFDFDDLLEKLVSIKLIKSSIGMKNECESIFSSRGKAFPYLHDLSHGLGLFLKSPPKSIEETYEKIEQVLSVYQTISRKNKARLIVCLFPQRFQVNDCDWEKTIDHYDLDADYFDLTIANSRIASFCNKNNIELLDLTPLMKDDYDKNHRNLYLPMGDMHWNKNGHQIAYEVIYSYITSK